jgi:hypothetical protein
MPASLSLFYKDRLGLTHTPLLGGVKALTPPKRGDWGGLLYGVIFLLFLNSQSF